MAITIGTDGYCAATDVTRRTGFDYDTDTEPSIAEVEGAITTGFHVINGRLEAAGFTIPPTRAQDLAILSTINMTWVFFNVSVLALEEKGPEWVMHNEKRFYKSLSEVVKGRLISGTVSPADRPIRFAVG